MAGPEDEFAAFYTTAEPRLRRALVAAYGVERGLEATAEALVYAWKNWDEISTMTNAMGYLYRVGQSRSREKKTPAMFPAEVAERMPWIEPGLPRALELLSERERLAVVLIESYGWTYREVADVAGLSASSVQSYLRRGLQKLRESLGVTQDA